jgi:hypothetical protein
MSLPTALDLKELTRTPADPATILRCTALTAIYTAAGTASGDGSITTGSISTGSASEPAIIAFLAELSHAGFSMTLSTGSFTVTWQR